MATLLQSTAQRINPGRALYFLWKEKARAVEFTLHSSVEEIVQQEQRPEPKANQQEAKAEKNEKKAPAEIKSVAELDMHLRELLREKELVRGFYILVVCLILLVLFS